MADDTGLRRSLGLPLLTLYGLGNIVGAGIYVLIGKVAGVAGASTPLAFVGAMTIAGITAMSYMELSARFPVSASVSVYLHRAFGRRRLSVAIGLAVVAGGITSAAALAQGFAGYLNALLSTPAALASVGLLLAVGVLAVRGISESAVTAAVLTVLEVAGLGLVIWFGRRAFAEVDVSELVRIDPAVGMGGVLAGAFLAFYAYIGFEDMVNVAEEARNPRRTMPVAILLALVISTVLYLLVVVVSTTVVAPAELAGSDAPLALVLERSGTPRNAALLAGIGMLAAVNGVIVQLIMGSRIVYGLAREGWITPRLAAVHPRFRTPVSATLVVLAAMVAGTLLLPLVSLAQLTSLLVLGIFTLVNVSLIVIKRRGGDRPAFAVPAAVPYLGAVLCVGMVAAQLLVPSLS
jgi:amino acid transporter